MAALNRRQLIKTAVAASVAGAAGLGGAAPARAAAPPHPALPDVPGMLGDRLANELWYQYEQAFNYNPSAEAIAAFEKAGSFLGGDVENIGYLYQYTRSHGTYPAIFLKHVQPAADAYATLSRLQLAVMDAYYRPGDHRLQDAFLAMGDGSLYDPRQPVGEKVHMMDPSGPNGEPTMSWHNWHAVIRAFTMLGIDADRWQRMDLLVGMGWEAQSTAKPQEDAFNVPLPEGVRRRIIRAWECRTPDEMDVAFDSFPYPAGIS